MIISYIFAVGYLSARRQMYLRRPTDARRPKIVVTFEPEAQFRFVHQSTQGVHAQVEEFGEQVSIETK